MSAVAFRPAARPGAVVRVVQALDAEWCAVLESGRLDVALARWADSEPALASYRSFADLEQISWAPDLDARDDMLAALVRLAQDPREPGRVLAARTVLQLMRPGLLQTVWDLARARRSTDVEEIAAAVFGAAHESTCRLRATPGRRKIAANLLLGARKIATTRGLLAEGLPPAAVDDVPERPGADEVQELAERDAVVAALAGAVRAQIIDGDDPAISRRAALPASAPDARDELVALLVAAVGARALSAEDARLTAASTRAGVGYRQLADLFGVSEPAVRKRRSRAVAKLANFVGTRGHIPAVAGA